MKPTLVTFLGGLGDRPAECIVATARWAACIDTIETASSTGAFDRAVLVTDGRAPPHDLAGVEVDSDGSPYHFGRRLAGVIRRHSLNAVVYLGGGSLPLLSAGDFSSVAEKLRGGAAVTNNAYSSDLVAFPIGPVAQGPSPEDEAGASTHGINRPVAQGPSPEVEAGASTHEGGSTVAQGPGPEQTLATIEAVARDNGLARALSEGTGISVEPLPRTIETQFDIDSPCDLLVLTLAGQGGPRLRAYLDSLELDIEGYRSLLPVFLDPVAQLLVAGRVGSHTWAYLERETACRVRLFAEERGMEAEGRSEAGTARSLLGFYLESAGRERFFEALGDLCDAAVLDTRVLLAHRRIHASREDRFLSDLGRYREISDPFLRDFTRAATGAAMPVILGGHSLMSGGLMLLNEHAWSERDAGRL